MSRRRRLVPDPTTIAPPGTSPLWFAVASIIIVILSQQISSSYVVSYAPLTGTRTCPREGGDRRRAPTSTSRPSGPTTLVPSRRWGGRDHTAIRGGEIASSVECGTFRARSYEYDVARGGWSSILDGISRALRMLGGSKKSRASTDRFSNEPDEGMRGTVIRTAVRPYQTSGGSKPSSPTYTTRKTSFPMIRVSEGGAYGDYNHYRTYALGSTPNRAISILTGDVGSYIRSLDGGYFADDGDGNDDIDDDNNDGDRRRRGYRDGDLGENILVDGVDFDYFEVGMRYRFFSSSSTSSDGEGDDVTTLADDVVIEITEPMEPCANLCKLPYINDPILEPRHRVARCQYVIEALGQRAGLRGWYAKVVNGGIVRVGDSLSPAIAMI